MLLQTLNFFNNDWCSSPTVLGRFMKGLYNTLSPKPKYTFIWDVSVVLKYLSSLVPLEKLSLRLLTLKLTALIALSTAPRAQTLVSLDLGCMNILNNKIVFHFRNLLKTSKQDKSFSLEICHYEKECLCAMHTCLHYIDRTKSLRKSQQLLVSYSTLNSVTSSTIARWLKTVLSDAGIDTNQFKAHSYRSAASSAAFSRGCSLDLILKTADWSSAKNFEKFYLREVESRNINFTEAVMDCN